LLTPLHSLSEQSIYLEHGGSFSDLPEYGWQDHISDFVCHTLRCILAGYRRFFWKKAQPDSAFDIDIACLSGLSGSAGLLLYF
jgi:hypothetical protein